MSSVAVSPAASGSRTVRLDSLTGLRWWAAFAVFAFHMRVFAPIPHTTFFVYGNYGVTFFFVLSGFVLTWSARPIVAPVTFWWRRFARIYPSHFVALLLAIPVFYSFNPDPTQTWVKPVSYGILALSFFLLQGWSRDPTILFSGNPAAWTLTCEAFFYALHPLIHRVFRPLSRRGALLATAGVIVLAFVYRVVVMLWPHAWPASLPLPLTRISEFIIGIGIARAMIAGWKVRIKPMWAYLFGGGLIVWLAVSVRWEAQNSIVSVILQTSNEWIIIACAFAIATVAWRDVTGARSLLRWRPLVVLGEWSYAFYLVHATFVYTALAVFGVQRTGWINVAWYAAILLLSLAGAALLHYAVEKPCERLLRARWDARLKRRALTAAQPQQAA
jgi:Predicted acyltransferases